MTNTRKCPKCGEVQNGNATYCLECGINMDKWYKESFDKEPDEIIEKPKKGSYEKNFFRGGRKGSIHKHNFK